MPPAFGQERVHLPGRDRIGLELFVYDLKPVEYHGLVKPKPRFTKSTLPEKICVRCKRPFSWRKRWEKVWDEVKYCSERCRKTKPD